MTQEKAEARDLLESNGLALFLVPEVTSSSLFLFLLTKVLYFCVSTIWLLAHLTRDLSQAMEKITVSTSQATEIFFFSQNEWNWQDLIDTKYRQMVIQSARWHCSCALFGNPWSNKEWWLPKETSHEICCLAGDSCHFVYFLASNYIHILNFFSAWDKSRVKWAKTQNQTQM